MHRTTSSGLVVAVLLWTAIAAADEHPDIAEARIQFEKVRFDRAGELLDAALGSGKLDAADVAAAYRLKAEIDAAVGDSEAAVGHFVAALSLDPDLELAEFASPKIVEALQAAREQAAGARLTVTHDIDIDARAVKVRVEGDAAGLIVAAALAYRLSDGSEKILRQEGSGEIAITLPEEATMGVSLYALDQHDNRLFGFYLGDLEAKEEEEENEKKEVAVPPPPPPPERGPGPLYTRWWLWAGVSGAFVVSGVTFGLLARSKQNKLDDIRENSGEHFFGEAKAAEDATRSRALGANISFALAGAAGVAAAVFFVLDLQGPEVEVAPAAGGVSARVRVQF